jgi:hypothetical protein
VARLDLGGDDGVGVLAQHLVVVEVVAAVVAQPTFQDVRGEAGVALVQVDGEQREADRRALLKQREQVEEGVGVLAAGHADQDAVAVLDERVVGDGAADAAEEGAFELGEEAGFAG